MSEIIPGPESVGTIDAYGTGGTALAQTISAAKCRLVQVDSRERTPSLCTGSYRPKLFAFESRVGDRGLMEWLKGPWTLIAARIAFDLGLPGSPPSTSALGRVT